MRRQTSFEKRQREKARQDRAAGKRERRAARAENPPDEEPDTATAPEVQSRVIAQLAELHDRFDRGDMEFEDFEEARGALLAQLDV